ncbi:MAG: hypothetical protein ACHQ2Y_03905 [Candidatus Lutacidiplasmatales archaeon]
MVSPALDEDGEAVVVESAQAPSRRLEAESGKGVLEELADDGEHGGEEIRVEVGLLPDDSSDENAGLGDEVDSLHPGRLLDEEAFEIP